MASYALQKLFGRNKQRRFGWAGRVARMVKKMIQLSVGEICDKETICKTRRRWEYNIKMDLKQIGGR
jgi:hypothetical protein